ncbi:MAG: hypothetical protein KDA60_15440 [Planctomycetales bacterium]|nr:hypothetical protein [Planctomycetales bacterium]
MQQITKRLGQWWPRGRDRLHIEMSDQELRENLQYGRDDEGDPQATLAPTVLLVK